MSQVTLPITGIVDAAGTVTLRVKPTGRQVWTVQQVGIHAPGVGGSAVGIIRKNGFPITPFVPQGDAPSGEPYVTLRPSDTLTISWEAATVGAAVAVTVIYDDGTR